MNGERHHQQPHGAEPPVQQRKQGPVRQYRCKQCHKVLFEARAVQSLSKRCPRCKTVNNYDE
jgi:predicted Zn-ribbon and HTH transcriptional regulator